STFDQLATPCEFMRQRRSLYRGPPGGDTTVLDGNAGLLEIALGKERRTARLDNIRALARSDFGDFLPSAAKLAGARVEPVERQAGIDQLEPVRFFTLSGIWRWTDHGEQRFNAMRFERTRELEAVNPHPPNGVRDEQQPRRTAHSAALARWRPGSSSIRRSAASHSARRASPSRQP